MKPDPASPVPFAYFKDGSIEHACPPLLAILHVMAYGSYEGKTINDPALRALFTREALLNSDWYKARLHIKQQREVALWSRHVSSLQEFLARPGYQAEGERLHIAARLRTAQAELERVSGPRYLEELEGTLGADPILVQDAQQATRSDAKPGELRALN